jgi:crotonobetainyl-CoA:carnitine CoA-transferase CaiB-like acyl-CoA transferase
MVEVPMFESMVAFNMVEHLYGQHFEPPRGTAGYPRVLAPLRRPYQTADGYVCMMPYTDAHWRDFFRSAGRDDLAADARFTDIAARTRHIETLYEITGELVRERSTDDWLEICEGLQIPVARVNDLDELIDDPHLKATGFFEQVSDPSMGTLRFPGAPVRFDGERARAALPPRLGEHTRAVLGEAGLDAQDIDALTRDGAAFAAKPR